MLRWLPSLLPLLIVTSATAADVAVNGSFEEVDPNGMPVRWAPVGMRVAVSPDAHTGQRALRLVRDTGTDAAETGVNDALDRERPKPLQGGIDFWYKAVSADSAQLNVYAIPMNEEPREQTSCPRATFTVPEGHVGDGQWHHARLKYDFTTDSTVKLVHFAARIVGSAGELLLDDISYVPHVGAFLQFKRVSLEEDPQRAGERGTISAILENTGDEAAEDVIASITLSPGLRVGQAELSLGSVAVDATATAVWPLEGTRDGAAELRFAARSGEIACETVLKTAPALEILSFGPTAPVAAVGGPATVECVLHNPGTAILLNRRAEFIPPSGPSAGITTIDYVRAE
jgi:hypothetical protein